MPRGASPPPPRPRLSCRRSRARACCQVRNSRSSAYLQRMNLSADQHEAEAHRDWTSRKAAGEPGLEDALAAALSEFGRRNGVAVFFPRGGHRILYCRNALKGLAFVAYDRIRCETLRDLFQRAVVFNLNVMVNRSSKLNRPGSSLQAGG